ncbi:putative quinol monooxygenase [Enemella sp. A6]|uniref:putative quinol monooxygenase n=1 Tax=Enemella sp. A6 TaxID=3440152 RepID=UPI003EBB44D2
MSDHSLHTIHRFRVPADDVAPLRDGVEALLAHWRTNPGWLDGGLTRNLDEPDLWLLWARWADVGAYRRIGLGGPAKTMWLPVMKWVIDEPSAYLAPEAL